MSKNNKKVDKQELVVCKRRGHDVILSERWDRCRYCRMWVREVRKIEERAEEPPEKEMSPIVQARRSLEKMKSA